MTRLATPVTFASLLVALTPFALLSAPNLITNVEASQVLAKPTGVDTCQEIGYWSPNSRIRELSDLNSVLNPLDCRVKGLLASFKNYLTVLQQLSLGSASANMNYGALRDRMISLATPEVLSEHQYMTAIQSFKARATTVLDRRDFCTYTTIRSLEQLKDLALPSKLLTLIYDQISIDFHAKCLGEAIRQLPEVPYLVKEVVQIYLSSTEQKLPDLNDEPEFSSVVEDARLAVLQEHASHPFDVQQAIAKNGPLESVMSLLLFMQSAKTNGNPVQAFKEACKQFLIDLVRSWDTMEMMSMMLDTEGNQIRTFNNFISRSLATTKYADACSQLSLVS